MAVREIGGVLQLRFVGLQRPGLAPAIFQQDPENVLQQRDTAAGFDGLAISAFGFCKTACLVKKAGAIDVRIEERRLSAILFSWPNFSKSAISRPAFSLLLAWCAR